MADNDNDDRLRDVEVGMAKLVVMTEHMDEKLDVLLTTMSSHASASAQGFVSLTEKLAAQESRLAVVEAEVKLAKSMAGGLRKILPPAIILALAGVIGGDKAIEAVKLLLAAP